MKGKWLVVLGGVILLMQGCGFQLRGSAADARNMPETFLQGGQPASSLRSELLRTDKISDTDGSGRIVLNLLNEGFERRVLTVGSADGKVREFEIVYSVNFEVKDTLGKVLLTPQTITLTREYLFDQTQVLGSDTQETLLRRDMARDAAGQIVRRLQALDL